MAVYTYRAINARRERVQGTISSESPRQAREQLRDGGLIVQKVVEHRKQPRKKLGWSFIPLPRDTATTTSSIRELSTLLAVGVPLLESLDTLVAQHRGRYRTCLLLLRESVASGGGLATAMAQQPQVFDALSIQMAEVGENSGTLDVVLGKLAEFKQRALELKDRVVSALLYPAIVLSVAVGVSVFLMTVVVPGLLENLIESGRTLPWPTRILKTCSDILLAHGGWLLLAGIAAALAVTTSFRTERGKRIWNHALLRIPLIGTMSQKQELAKTSLIISTLMNSGIEFLQALEIAKRTTSSPLLRDALQRCEQQVGAGQDIGEALAESSYIPPMVVHIFTVGQTSGQLEQMLERLSEDYDRQVASMAGRLSSVLEPILILVLAVFVGFILFATMLPILEAGNVL